MEQFKIPSFEDHLNEAAKFASKKDIMNLLKRQGYGAVKWETESGDKTFKGGRKGFRGGSYGPMTGTDAHMVHTKNVKAKVMDSLNYLSLYYGDDKKIMDASKFLDVVNIQTSATSVRQVIFTIDDYPTYAPSMDYDPSYTTHWVIITFVDFKIKK